MNPSVLIKALAAQGPAWALTRLKIELKKRTGTLRGKTPLRSWASFNLREVLTNGVPVDPKEYLAWRQDNQMGFFFHDVSELAPVVGNGAVASAEEILKGRFPFFSRSREFGFPPDWQKHPETRMALPEGHWSNLNAFRNGDIKFAWELSRFSWTFHLVRAYAKSGDERYPQAFWQLFESWQQANPPYSGINWMCGQETAFRAMALCFAFYGFARSSSSTAQRISKLLIALSVHATRIEVFLEYALSQKNNHGISEATGLWTIGLLFPELKHAERFTSVGKVTIEREVRRQIYADGSYVQHSLNYHRVMLHDVGWALRLGECNGRQLASDLYRRFDCAVRFLFKVVDPESGWAPNYGANDGALVLPLSDCEYPDMRSVLQSSYFMLHRERLYSAGPWDEEMAWLNGIAAERSRATQSLALTPLDAGAGGYFSVRGNRSWLMLRGARYRDRPSHADQLHVDLWWKGENVLCDPGTYSYNAPAPFDDGFASSRFHNTVTVDARDQMTRVSRFLWGDWAQGQVQRHSRGSGGNIAVVEGAHNGYGRLGVWHRRGVLKARPDTWIIVDDLIGSTPHRFRVHWLLPDVEFEEREGCSIDFAFQSGSVKLLFASNAAVTMDIVRAGDRLVGAGSAVDPTRGWISRFYGQKTPALSVALEGNAKFPVRIITVLVLGSSSTTSISPDVSEIALGSDRVPLTDIGGTPIFATDRDAVNAQSGIN